MTRSVPARSLRAAVLLLAGAAPALGSPVAASDIRPCRAGPDPYEVRLVPTAHANGASGIVRLTFAESPYVVTVTAEGHHRYQAHLSTEGLDGRSGSLVAWAATPELDQVQKLGVLSADGVLPPAEITFNKFLVFVTEEEDAGVERWRGRILLRGISPSGRLHTMAGHGPFQGESCGGLFGPQW
ncbi:MAG TPA: hypothetical protein VFU06_09730 [Longimicrobiales bacterium]|nr:hypothetical protein [Longimicrobiales bacterium]